MITAELLYRERWERLWDGAESAGYGALLVAGRGAPGEYGALYYSCGFMAGHRPAFAVIGPGPRLTLIPPSEADGYLSRAAPGVAASHVVIPSPGTSSAANVVAELRRLGITNTSRVGTVALDSIGHRAWKSLEEGISPASLHDATLLFATAKAPKGPSDHAALARAGGVADSGLAAAERAVRSGSRVASVKAAIQAEVARSECDLTLILVGTGPMGGTFTDRQLSDGDVVSVMVELSLGGYWVEAGSAFTVGSLRSATAAMSEECLELLDSLSTLLVPGATPSSLARHATDFVSARGRRASLSLGHGVGIDSDMPDITAAVETPLSDGAAIALHPSIANLEMDAGVALANTYIVRESSTVAVSERGGRIHVGTG